MKLVKVGANNGNQNNGNQYQRSYDRPDRQRNTNETSAKSNWLDDLQCWFCTKEGHTARDCPEQVKMLEDGILKRNAEGRIELKDGSRLPFVRFGEPGPTRAERVLAIAKEKGWMATNSVAAQSMLYEVEEEPPVVNNFHLALEQTLKEIGEDESHALAVLMKKLGGSKN